VLLDLMMPEMDGYAVIEQMRQSKQQAISILVTTAADRRLSIERLRWAQPIGYRCHLSLSSC
jgi:CheY-like chemotaxis protein